MHSIYTLSQAGLEKARLPGEIKQFNAPGARDPKLVNTWDLFLRCDSPGIMMDGTTFEVVGPGGKSGTAIATKHQNGVLHLAGSGPSPA